MESAQANPQGAVCLGLTYAAGKGGTLVSGPLRGEVPATSGEI